MSNQSQLLSEQPKKPDILTVDDLPVYHSTQTELQMFIDMKAYMPDKIYQLIRAYFFEIDSDSATAKVSRLEAAATKVFAGLNDPNLIFQMFAENPDLNEAGAYIHYHNNNYKPIIFTTWEPVHDVLRQLGSGGRASFFKNDMSDPRMLGKGLITREYEEWARLRSIVNEAFSKSQLDLYIRSMSKLTQKRIGEIGRRVLGKKFFRGINYLSQVDLSKDFTRITIDNLTSTMFGEEMDKQSRKVIVDITEKASQLVAIRFITPDELISAVSGFKELAEEFLYLREKILYPIIAKRINTLIDSKEVEPDMLTSFLKENIIRSFEISSDTRESKLVNIELIDNRLNEVVRLILEGKIYDAEVLLFKIKIERIISEGDILGIPNETGQLVRTRQKALSRFTVDEYQIEAFSSLLSEVIDNPSLSSQEKIALTKERLSNIDNEWPIKIEIGLSFGEIIDQMTLFLFAGSVSTSSLIGWGLHVLSMRPDIQNKLLDELELLQNKGINLQELTAEDLKQMPTIFAFVDELLRVYPPFPFFSREYDPKDPNLPETLLLKLHQKGKLLKIDKPTDKPIELGFNIFAINMSMADGDPNYPAREFIIERHLNKTDNKPLYISFLEGALTCVGRQFSREEAVIFFIHFLTTFNVKYDPNRKDTYRHGSINQAGNPRFNLEIRNLDTINLES